MLMLRLRSENGGEVIDGVCMNAMFSYYPGVRSPSSEVDNMLLGFPEAEGQLARFICALFTIIPFTEVPSLGSVFTASPTGCFAVYPNTAGGKLAALPRDLVQEDEEDYGLILRGSCSFTLPYVRQQIPEPTCIDGDFGAFINVP